MNEVKRFIVIWATIIVVWLVGTFLWCLIRAPAKLYYEQQAEIERLKKQLADAGQDTP